MPNVPSLTIAKRLFRLHPEVYRTINAATMAVRTYRGAAGKRWRLRYRHSIVTKAVRTPEQAESAKVIARIPTTDATSWLPHVVRGASRIAIFADAHLPYHEPLALEQAIAQAKRRRPDLVLLNGDILDCYAISRWEKDPRKRSLKGEITHAREFFAYLRQQLRCPILWKLGNHEERYWSYLAQRAPDLVGLPQFEPEKVFGLADAGAEIIGKKRIILLGELPVIHGHEYPAAVLSPVNAARGYFLRAKGNVLGSHFHQKSEHFEPNIKGRQLAAWSTGCLCDLHPEYARLNRWSHGWAFVELAKAGTFAVDNIALPNL